MRLQRLQGLQPQRFFALARAGQQHHGALLPGTPGAALGQLQGIGLHVELQIAHHSLHRRAQAAQALGVGLGLCPHRRQPRVGRARQPRQALGLAQRRGIEPGIGQHQRHALGAANGHQIGPDLGFHQQAKLRTKVAHKTLHSTGGIPWQPGLQIAGLQQFGPFGAARGGAMGEQHAHGGPARTQCRQQDGGGACFPQGDGVNPHQRRLARLRHTRGAVVVAKALGNVLGVARLGLGTAAQLAPQQRLRRPSQGAVEPKHRAHGRVQGTRWERWERLSALLRPPGHRV